jgi:hypothetical protein
MSFVTSGHTKPHIFPAISITSDASPSTGSLPPNPAFDPCLLHRRLSFVRGHHQDVVDDVPAGAITGKEEATEVFVLR